MEDAGIDAVRQVNPGLKRRKLNTNLPFTLGPQTPVSRASPPLNPFGVL
jgi:hypothetical protein